MLNVGSYYGTISWHAVVLCLWFLLDSCQDNFPTDVLSSSHSWVVLFINCNSDLGRVNAAISHAHDLNQTAHALQQSEEAHLKFGIVDTACSKKSECACQLLPVAPF